MLGVDLWVCVWVWVGGVLWISGCVWISGCLVLCGLVDVCLGVWVGGVVFCVDGWWGVLCGWGLWVLFFCGHVEVWFCVDKGKSGFVWIG